MISAANLGFTYLGASAPAISGIDLTITPGDFIYLTGPSGCGKSTLVNLIAGILSDPDDGVMTGTLDVGSESHPGLVIQNVDAQFFNLRVWEEIRYGPENMGLDPVSIELNVERAVSIMGIGELLDRETSSLSMGERQLVAIASILSMDLEVVLLDEPTANLDYRHSCRLYDALSRICRERETAVILADHRNDGLGDTVKRTLVLDHGRILAEGDGGLLTNAGLLKSMGVRMAKRMNRNILHGRRSGSLPSSPGLEIRDLRYSKGDREILRGVNLKVDRGEVAGLLGEPGSGKTTLGLLAAGILRKRSGEISVMGLSPEKALSAGSVGMVLQNPKHQLFCDTVEEEISYAPRNFGRYDEEYTDFLSGAMGLDGLMRRSVHSLSGGQSQRLAIASGLSARPGLVILDEPTSGQDWGNLEILGRVFDRLRADGTAVLVITHDWRLANRFFDTCHFLENGSLISRERYIDTMLSSETGAENRTVQKMSGDRPAVPVMPQKGPRGIESGEHES